MILYIDLKEVLLAQTHCIVLYEAEHYSDILQPLFISASTMAILTTPLCFFLLGALCLTNAATATVQGDLVDAAKFLYDSLSQAQVQRSEPLPHPPLGCWYDSYGYLICG